MLKNEFSRLNFSQSYFLNLNVEAEIHSSRKARMVVISCTQLVLLSQWFILIVGQVLGSQVLQVRKKTQWNKLVSPHH